MATQTKNQVGPPEQDAIAEQLSRLLSRAVGSELETERALLDALIAEHDRDAKRAPGPSYRNR